MAAIASALLRHWNVCTIVARSQQICSEKVHENAAKNCRTQSLPRRPFVKTSGKYCFDRVGKLVGGLDAGFFSIEQIAAELGVHASEAKQMADRAVRAGQIVMLNSGLYSALAVSS